MTQEKTIRFIVETKKGDEITKREFEVKNYSGWIVVVSLVLVLVAVLFKDEIIEVGMRALEWLV